MKHRTRNIQIISIFVVIVAAFLGSSILFFRIHTFGLKSTIEAETNLFASILSHTISTDYPTIESLDPEKAAETITATIAEHAGEIADIDIWIVSEDGTILTADSEVRDSAGAELVLETARETGEDKGWIGKQELLFLKKNYYALQPLYNGKAHLAILNYCVEAHALQRQQSAIFIGVMLTLLLIVVVLIANLISNYRVQLIRLATTDELTGLMNRKSFNAEFARFFETKHGPACLFLLDIDFFKQINDSKGHAAGDHALRFLADHIQEMVKKQGGFAGRWGGDEFIGVLNQDGGQTLNALNELCREIEGSETPDGFRMTISAGAAEFGNAKNFEAISEKTDAALYTSKERGRNQATLYQKGMMSEPGAVRESAGTSTVSESLPAQAGHAAETVSALPAGAEAEKTSTVRKRFAEQIQTKLIPSILSGVRWMAPFVAGGGILIALAFLFDAASVDMSALSVEARANFGSITPMAAMLKEIGGITFNFMLPVFAGFMAAGLAGDDAFMAGFVGGYMTIQSNAGFVGAMIAGLAAGFIANEIQQFTGRLPKFIRKIAPIVIYPVFNLLLMWGLTVILITPVSSAIGNLFSLLLTKAEAVSEAAAAGLAAMMMAVDMGGIVNKVAYNYGVDGLLLNRTRIMASVMAGGMIPPIGIFLSMLFSPNSYSEEERERGASTLFMGLSFITEGALPFVFTDPLRVIPSCMAGSALAGILSALYGCELPAPHGGIFVFPVMSHSLLYILALFSGSAVTALMLGFLKKSKHRTKG